MKIKYALENGKETAWEKMGMNMDITEHS